MKVGLVSVTFRKLTPKDIVLLCKEAGLDGIEWGSDVHATDVERAKEICALMEENGLETFSLGSYYTLGKGQDFEEVLAIAKALHAPNIRIWAGSKECSEITEEEVSSLAAEAQHAADRCLEEGMTLSFEYHSHSLTSEQTSAMELIKKIDRSNVRLYWQPLEHIAEEKQEKDLKELNEQGILENLHVYYWIGFERQPLSDAKERWQKLFSLGSSAKAALLEFVKEDDPKQFLKDAKTLREISSFM